MLTKCIEKKLDGEYKIMLHAILDKSWMQQPTKQQLNGHLPPISQTIQVRQTRHEGHCRSSKDEFLSDILSWTITYVLVLADQQRLAYFSSVQTQDAA